MIRTILALLGSVLLVFGSTACSDLGSEAPPKQNGDDNHSYTVSFKNDVHPVLMERCLGCHGINGGFSVESHHSITEHSALHGPVIVAGDAEASHLYLKISHTPPFGARMPVGGPYLDSSTIAKIKAWIDEGAEDN